MPFVDEVEIRVQSGAGGDGCVSFRREKFIPFGGPNGGNGGHGGAIYLVPTRNKHTLLDFRFQPFYRADRGAHGKGKDMDGRSGEDLLIQVPVGTMVFENETGEMIADLTEESTPFLVAKGGYGGRGNRNFTSSVRQAPRFATPGKPGESQNLRLELRLLADVGLVGLPNAGKSSLLRKISHAEPKVADYPFTTLSPSLGVVDHKSERLIFADLPGLIEGAAHGAGLGHRFLKHVFRNRMLLHLVDSSYDLETLEEHIRIIRGELGAHDPDLLERPQLLVYTKADLLTEEDRIEKDQALRAKDLEGHFISSATGFGISELLDVLVSKAMQWRLDVPLPIPEKEDQTSFSEELV